ncbi:hypothetical protein NX801_02595 [Streptomyces sp. LP05-1]|uniref:Uncharacterized protein n=1 Tax=Streptomyces pyxinae TaxID=2970734 RepID=A0ABT2CB29_9ACTN|nr:hypothetical protein [Streptomyces sp. LP05-1]MCS0634568.1 hypothetical protein [Streptomyces sp. LP05-1]
MSVARRPLLTATAAGTLLCALWFVPSANATDEAPAGGTPDRARTAVTDAAGAGSRADSGSAAHRASDVSARTPDTPDTPANGALSADGAVSADDAGPADDDDTAAAGPVLADTGAVDTAPYLIGGTAFLGMGAGLVAFAVRKGAPAAH